MGESVTDRIVLIQGLVDDLLSDCGVVTLDWCLVHQHAHVMALCFTWCVGWPSGCCDLISYERLDALSSNIALRSIGPGSGHSSAQERNSDIWQYAQYVVHFDTAVLEATPDVGTHMASFPMTTPDETILDLTTIGGGVNARHMGIRAPF